MLTQCNINAYELQRNTHTTKCLQHATKCLRNATKCQQNTMDCWQNATTVSQNTTRRLQNATKCLQNATQCLRHATKCLQNATKCLHVCNAARHARAMLPAGRSAGCSRGLPSDDPPATTRRRPRLALARPEAKRTISTINSKTLLRLQKV